MKKILLLIGILLTNISFSQEEFITFLKSDNLPKCFQGLADDQVEQLVTEQQLRANNTTYLVDYESFKEVLYLTTTSHCDDIQRVHLKHIEKDSMEYIFMYKERVPNSGTYGRLRVYHLEDGEWVMGRKIEVTWQTIFQISEKELKRLESVDQVPKYMLSFEADNIVFDIPWKLYTFGEGSETDGFAKGGGKKPAKLPYRYFFISN